MLAPTFLKPAERLAPNFLVATTAFLAPSLIFKPTFLAPALTLDEPALILSPSLAAPTLTFLMIFFMVGVKRVIKVFIGLPVTPGAPWEAPLIILAKVLDWKHLVSSLIWTTTILLFLPHFNDLAALKSTITGPVATGFLTVTLTDGFLMVTLAVGFLMVILAVGFLTVILAVGFLTVILALATGFLTIICNILRPALALTLSLTFGTLIFNPDLTEATAFLAP